MAAELCHSILPSPFYSTIQAKIVAVLALLLIFYTLHHSQPQLDDATEERSTRRGPNKSTSTPIIDDDQQLWQTSASSCLLDNNHKRFSNGSLLPRRARSVSISEYGGVGDGTTLNTAAFQRAMADLAKVQGGAELHVPAGHWLTGSFNLTSHLTVYLERGAVILGSQVIHHWPLIEPLPSYGSGRERLGRRHSSLLHGDNVVDVWVTGENGTIDGQGWVWWEMWRNRTLLHTRGHLLEFVSSQNIVISNVVLRNSPFWTLHPVYCNNFIVKNVTILAPWNAPNTDGIDPDSSSNVCIEDCYISNGDDLISIKSGWDEYGMRVARPSVNITVRRVTGTSATCSGIAFGSEVSGGIENILVEDMHVVNVSSGIRLKTAPGRGGYIRNVTIMGMMLERVKRAIEFSADAGEHPEDIVGGDVNRISIKPHHNESLSTIVAGIIIKNVVGIHIVSPGRFIGTPQTSFQDVFLYNISLNAGSSVWSCSHAYGCSKTVSPPLCLSLQSSMETCGRRLLP